MEFSFESMSVSFWNHVMVLNLVGDSMEILGSVYQPRVASEIPKCQKRIVPSSISPPEGTKTSGDLPDGVTAAQIITDCGYWRLVAILPLTELEEPQTRSFCWLTTCCMSNFFSSVNTKLGSVPWSISSRIWLFLSILILLWCSVSSWRWSIL